MIPYHGLPIGSQTVALEAIGGGHAFVSHLAPHQIALALEVCQSIALDNGAFSAWKRGAPITDWRPFYAWVESLRRHPAFDFAVIPDVIDGDEAANDALLEEWPFDRVVGAPVWHMHESIDRLQRLARDWRRVCIGSSAAYSVVGSSLWWIRIHEAMHAICDERGYPICKLHGLRMLNVKVFSQLPFSSADSTNVGQNVGVDVKWKGTYLPPTKEARARILRQRIESHNGAQRWPKESL